MRDRGIKKVLEVTRSIMILTSLTAEPLGDKERIGSDKINYDPHFLNG